MIDLHSLYTHNVAVVKQNSHLDGIRTHGLTDTGSWLF